MNPDQVALYRAIFEGTRLDDDVMDFSAALGAAPQEPGGLLLVGTPEDEPWHFAAHLTDEAEWAERPEMSPLLVRWSVPDGAPPHLAIGMERLEDVRKRETLLVVAPTATPERLLDRLDDARRTGALVMAIESGDTDLRGIANESLTVPQQDGTPFLDVVQHVVSQTAPTLRSRRQRSMRTRLGILLDRLQGSAEQRPPMGWR